MNKTIAIIPVYNEGKNIIKVIEDIYQIMHEANQQIDVLVVNDGSTDDTAEIIKQNGYPCIHMHKNVGKNRALSKGIIYALQKKYHYIIQIDGDGQHPIEHIPHMLEYVQNNNVDIVIGSRFIQRKGYQSTFWRKMGITYLNKLISLILTQSITDCTSGFRLLNFKAAILSSHCFENRHNEVTILCQYANNKLIFKEIPVHMKKRQGGKSSFNHVGLLKYAFISSFFIIWTAFSYKFLDRKM